MEWPWQGDLRLGMPMPFCRVCTLLIARLLMQVNFPWTREMVYLQKKLNTPSVKKRPLF